MSIPIFLKYDNFTNSLPVKTNGDARIENNYLLLTPAEPSKRGSAYYGRRILLPSNGSFSTYFVFQINVPEDSSGADGFTFTVQPNSNEALGSDGAHLGYGESNQFPGIDNSLAVEFDTYFNPSLGDINANHAGVDTNGSVFSINQNPLLNFNISNGNEYHVWIDYNGNDSLGGNLQVRVGTTNNRSNAVLVLNQPNFNLPFILGRNDVFIGFTGSTGAAFEDHRILLWYLDNKYNPIDTSVNEYVQASGRGLIVE